MKIGDNVLVTLGEMEIFIEDTGSTNHKILIIVLPHNNSNELKLSKDAINKVNKSHTQDKIFSVHISDSNLLVSKIYKQLLLLNKKNQTTQLHKKKT